MVIKKDLWVRAPLKEKKKERCLRSDEAGEGLGEGEASPSPPRRENFEMSPPSNGVSLHLRLNSIAFSLHTTHIVFNTITFCSLSIVSFVSISYSVFGGWKMTNMYEELVYPGVMSWKRIQVYHIIVQSRCAIIRVWGIGLKLHLINHLLATKL